MIKKYNEFLITEKYDSNIKAKLISMGITDKDELRRQVHLAKHGNLGKYLEEKGDVFTFGILNAIFKDAIMAKKKTNIKRGIFNILPSVIPLALVPFFPTIAIISSVFGTSRIFHKIFDPIFNYINPQSKYADFLKSVIDSYMKIPEGEVNLKDRFTRAFVVSDRFIDAIKQEVLDDFSNELSKQMSNMDQDIEVPPHYIENELKIYINSTFGVSPEIPLKEGYTIEHFMNEATRNKSSIDNISYINTYIKNISISDMDDILLDFSEEYDLDYKIIPNTILPELVERSFLVEFFISNTDITFREHLQQKAGHALNLNWDLLYEIDDRLSEYNLTIRNNGIFDISYIHNRMYLRVIFKQNP